MVKWITKNKNNIVMIILFLMISILDYFDPSSLMIRMIMVASTIILTLMLGFIRPYIDVKLGAILFVFNAGILFLSIKTRVYFANIYVLSWIAWNYTSRFLTNKKNTLYITYILSLISVYLFLLLGLNRPLVTIVFFPLYITGCNIKSEKISLKHWENVIIALCIYIEFIMLKYVIQIEGAKESIHDMIMFNSFNKGARILTITIIIWAICCLIGTSCFYLLINLINTCKSNKDINFGNYEGNKSNFILTLNLKFLTMFSLVYMGECILRREVITPIMSIMDVHQAVNLIFIVSLFIAMINVFGDGLGRTIFYLAIFLLFIANFIKLKFFDEPFYPWDLYLIKTGIMIMNNYINYKVILIVAMSITILTVVVVKFRRNFFHVLRPNPNRPIVVFSLILFLCNFFALDSGKYLSEVNMGKSWYTGKSEAMQNGFFVENFYLIKDYKTYLADKPMDYSKDKIIDIVDNLNKSKDVETSSNLQVKPNVIVIMSESFWDATKLSGVKFDKELIKNVKANEKGAIVSPVFGGGTANVEFEALTGFSNYFMNSGVMPYNVYLRRTTPSIATAFDKNGYDTVVIHPNDKNFYNRDKVYKYFGFNKFIDESGFNKNKDCKGSNISDEKLVDSILSQVDNNDRPKFIFGITIQNHDPYYNEYENLEVNTASEKLNSTELSILNNYASGIYDADKAFGRLIQELGKKEQPTLVYYFGDHMPRLGNPLGYYDVYNALGYFKNKEKIDSDINCYKTPLAIWCNYKEIKPIGENISPAQLALQILKDSGIAYPVYFDILGELKKDHPYLQNHLDSQSIQSEQIVKDYKLIQYDLLFGKQYLMEK